jgi:SAM-dependent MidA family methyltransferase
MELALYDPQFGYYARAARRSGRAGDFFTSVDVGAVFGGLLAIQIAEMAGIVTAINAETAKRANPPSSLSASLALTVVDLVEAGASDGRLSADILRALARDYPQWYERVRLHLVETSAAARAAQRAALGEAAARIASSGPDLPDAFEGVLVANELLDALPVHQVVMREDGLREVYVADGHRLVEGPPSTPALAEYLERLGITLEPGWRVEINLRALDWIRQAARRLRRGFLILIDYGHEARDLYSASHSAGTLTTFTRHTMAGPEAPDAPAWLRDPGERDITAHVDFTSVCAAAEAEGLKTLGFLDQTYFLLGLLKSGRTPVSGDAGEKGVRPLFQLKTLVMPGGLGSTHKVLILGKDVGAPALAGCSFRVRVT